MRDDFSRKKPDNKDKNFLRCMAELTEFEASLAVQPAEVKKKGLYVKRVFRGAALLITASAAGCVLLAKHDTGTCKQTLPSINITNNFNIVIGSSGTVNIGIPATRTAGPSP